MRLSEYSDDELIEEIKHRGIKIEFAQGHLHYLQRISKIKIGGVVFDLRT